MDSGSSSKSSKRHRGRGGHDAVQQDERQPAAADDGAIQDGADTDGEDAPKGPVYRSRSHRFWVEWVRPLLIVFLLLTCFRSTVADWNDVPTGSMEPTILPGDRIAVNKLSYDLKIPFTDIPMLKWGNPERGDIVVFIEPESGMRMVKRVIGVPGDTIELRNRQLIINDSPVRYKMDGDTPEFAQVDQVVEDLPGKKHMIQVRPYKPNLPSFDPKIVPEDMFFVMGDNRDNSRDSRVFGFVPRNAVVGRSFGVALSFGERGIFSPRWDRFFSGLE